MELAALDGVKARYHGDYHLGQVLVAENDFIITDFEGEPARTLAERRRKHSPLRDVAGMLRSLHYAAQATIRKIESGRPSDRNTIDAFARDWQERAATAFLRGYADAADEHGVYGANLEPAKPLIELFVLEKALYELRYELDNRPSWVGLPIAGLLEALEPR